MKAKPSILLIIKIYLLAISIFFIFRAILFVTAGLDKINFSEVSYIPIIKAFIMGIRFDIVISGYILALPFLILSISEILKINFDKIKQIVFYWVFTLFTISFIICAADIPYFNQFYERFSIGAFEWFDNIGFVFSMIIQEPRYFIYIILFLLIDILFFILLRRIFRKKIEPQRINVFYNIILSLVFLSLIFLGIRGRIEKKSPIRVGTAYFSNNSFLNKLGLNPVFTFMRSYLDSKDKRNETVSLIDNKIANIKIKQYLNIGRTSFNSPVAREIIPDTISQNRPNIVIVIMESMSAAKMKRFGNKNNLTPFLDSLSYNSIFFENFYSAGKHTFNGIFSTLFSFPALYRQHTMKQIRKYDGIASTLLKYGYTTTFFTTHDAQFDNMEGFLRANNFQNIISQADYPSSEIKTTLGVPDDYMFRYSIPVINNLYKQKKPFLVAFMTASDHGPYYVPDYFHPKNKKIRQQTVEYADWSLKKFITMASKQKWFDNTILVFVADHGAPINAHYDIAMNYFHIPLIIYAPKLVPHKSKTYKKIGSQIDIYPTLMGLLHYRYINNTLGIDLLNEDRKYAIINDDDKIGIVDTSFLCIMKNYGRQLELYNYRDNDKVNYYHKYRERADKMAEFAKVNLQVTQEMILKKQTTLQNSQPKKLNIK